MDHIQFMRENGIAAFAEAEAHLIEHAVIVPFSISTSGYVATRLNPFEGQYAPYGLALQRFKYQHLLEAGRYGMPGLPDH